MDLKRVACCSFDYTKSDFVEEYEEGWGRAQGARGVQGDVVWVGQETRWDDLWLPAGSSRR
jgi:hypothetical protein